MRKDSDPIDYGYRKSLSHGFRKKHSIVTNAKKHRNKRYVFNVDLKSFFPSINFGRIHGYFIKSRDFQLKPDVATVIAQIACHDNELPQGSPVSPVLSNLIGHLVDIRLVKLAKRAKCSYSRYADDITFSTRKKDFPPLIASQEESEEWLPSKNLVREIERTGFEINPKKTSMQYNVNRQMVTGLVVNRAVNIKASYYRQARSMCNALFRTGHFYIGREMREELKPGTVNQLRGVLSHIYNIKKPHDQREQKEKWAKPTAIHLLYEKFLLFTNFHALTKPIILCEGKTDSVYLKCAIKSLSSSYPMLTSKTDDLSDFTINFFNHSETNMDILQFSGGTGDFKQLIVEYETKLRPFISDGKKFPVIMLIDNDKGSQDVFSVATKKFEKSSGTKVNGKIEGKKEFYHLLANLYLVSIPKKTGSSDNVMIEDLFEEKVKNATINGKTFNPNKKTFIPAKHYGKHKFSEEVIRANQHKINFDGFRDTLDRISMAIDDYSKKMSSS